MLVRLGLCLILAGFSTAYAHLPYQQGGDPDDPADPGADVAAMNKRYICPSGNDSNNGEAPNRPWATVGKVKSEANNIPPGALILFCRGGVWSSRNHDLRDVQWGDPGNPTVFGAYGTGPLPRFQGDGTDNPSGFRLNGSSYFTLRDLDAVKFSMSSGAHDFLVFRTVCRGDPVGGYARFCYGASGESHNGAFIENLAYDIVQRDLYLIHANESDGTPTLDHWWFIGNVGIGSSGMEDCIDATGSETDQQPNWNNPDPTQDIKMVAFYCNMQSVDGLSTLSGQGDRCMNGGHENEYYWLVGTFCRNPTREAWYRGEDTRGWQVSGNVSWRDTDTDKPAFSMKGPDVSAFHNTVLQTSMGFAYRTDRENFRFDHNLILMTGEIYGSNLIRTDTPDTGILSMDHNFYSPAGLFVTDGQTLTQRQLTTPFDQNSQEGSVAGIKIPGTAWNDPRNWRSPEFSAQFKPNTKQGICNGADSPGAFDCDGNPLGLEINPISGAPTVDGPPNCGWMASEWPIVAVKLAEYGVNGSCVASNMARPRPPQLFVSP